MIRIEQTALLWEDCGVDCLENVENPFVSYMCLGALPGERLRRGRIEKKRKSFRSFQSYFLAFYFKSVLMKEREKQRKKTDNETL